MLPPISGPETIPQGGLRGPFVSRRYLAVAAEKPSIAAHRSSAPKVPPATPSRFPHRPRPDPRGFLPERFSNAGRDRSSDKPRTPARIGKSSSKRTGALQHERPISWRSECPLPEQAASTLATTANVGNPPFLSPSRTAQTCPSRHATILRRGSPKLQFMHRAAIRASRGPLCGDTVEKVGDRSVLTSIRSEAIASPAHAGAGMGTNLASLRRFWAVAASWNCSVAPLGPRSRIIRSPMYRFRWAKSISTFRLCMNEVM